jgi:hypothetical protein
MWVGTRVKREEIVCAVVYLVNGDKHKKTCHNYSAATIQIFEIAKKI